MDPQKVLEQAQKIEVTQAPVTGEQFESFMRGDENAHMSGGRYDTESRGVFSGGQAQRFDPLAQAPQEAPSEETDYLQQSPPAESEPDWKKLYGNSENDKGQWRRTAEEAMSQLELMRSELQAMREGFAPHTGYTPQPPAYMPQPSVPQATQPQLPDSFFPEKQDNDLVEVKDVNRLVHNAIAPAVWQLHLQTIELQKAQVEALKTSNGITPQIERTLATRHPWIAQMPEGPARIQAMVDILRSSRVGTPVTPVASSAPQRTQSSPVGPHEAAARRVVYVESGQKAGTPREDIPLEQQVAQEMAAAKTAAEKKAVLMKYGIYPTNDWGRDVLTR